MAGIEFKPPPRIQSVHDIDYCLKILEHKEKVIIDLTATKFIRPIGVVSLLAILTQVNGGVEFLLTGRSPVAVYLRQVGAFDVMREYGSFPDIQPEDVIPYEVPVKPMVPCTHFQTESTVDQLANEMEELFHTDFLGLTGLLQPCHTIFSELAANVVAHAESDGGFVLAQRYDFKTGSIVEIAVADCGIGIRRSLEKNPALGPFESDGDAMVSALQEGVSSLEDSHRGFGLTYVAENVNSVQSRSLTIRSGNGILTLRGNGSIKQYQRSMPFPGTIVTVRVPC